jgi:tripartite-type tricarboxylate transporter receptor subunit TctC
MTCSRRALITATGGLLCLGTLLAQTDYPSKALRMLVPFSAGGSPDLMGRLIANQLTRQMGQGVVVDNRLGANGIVATEAVANAPADGYTLLLTTGSHVINPRIYRKLPYDSFADFAPVGLLSVAPALTLVVNPQSPIRSIRDFLTQARQTGTSISYGSPGTGNTLHLAGELLNLMAGTHMLHVPYKGAAPALNAVMAGEVTACFLSTAAATLAVKAGQVRPLAVTSSQRIGAFPDVPTLAESGVAGFDYNGGWIGILAHARTPRSILTRLQTEVTKALQVQEVRDKLNSWESPPSTLYADEFGKFMLAESEKFSHIVRQANIPQQ